MKHSNRKNLTNVHSVRNLSQHRAISNRICTCTRARGPSNVASVQEAFPNTRILKIISSCTPVSLRYITVIDINQNNIVNKPKKVNIYNITLEQMYINHTFTIYFCCAHYSGFFLYMFLSLFFLIYLVFDSPTRSIQAINRTCVRFVTRNLHLPVICEHIWKHTKVSAVLLLHF